MDLLLPTWIFSMSMKVLRLFYAWLYWGLPSFNPVVYDLPDSFVNGFLGRIICLSDMAIFWDLVKEGIV